MDCTIFLILFHFPFTVTFEKNNDNDDAIDPLVDDASVSSDNIEGDISEPENYCDGLRNLFSGPSNHLGR